MKHFHKWKLILLLLPLFIIAGVIINLMAGNLMSVLAANTASSQDQSLAKSILSKSNIVLAKSHRGGLTDKLYCTAKIDHATAYCNIVELSNGQKAARSSYFDPSQGQAGPGGSTTVVPLLLQIILAAASSGHQVGVMEIAGGVHSTHQMHYSGHAIDFNMFDGQSLSGRNQASIQFIQLILSLLPSGSGIGESQCGQTPPSLAKSLQSHQIATFPDSCGHVHIQIP